MDAKQRGHDRDINVRTTLDTGCCPGNYMKQEYFDRNVEALGPFLVPSVPERVDLATNGSSRENMRLMKLKFGILWHLPREYGARLCLRC